MIFVIFFCNQSTKLAIFFSRQIDKRCYSLSEILYSNVGNIPAALLPENFRHLKNVRFFFLCYKRENIRQLKKLPVSFVVEQNFSVIWNRRFKIKIFFLPDLGVDLGISLLRDKYLNHWSNGRFLVLPLKWRLGVFLKWFIG